MKLTDQDLRLIELSVDARIRKFKEEIDRLHLNRVATHEAISAYENEIFRSERLLKKVRQEFQKSQFVPGFIVPNDQLEEDPIAKVPVNGCSGVFLAGFEENLK